MDLRAFNSAGVADVTQDLADDNPANRLYQLPSGVVVKVKTYEIQSGFLRANQRLFQITSSVCDASGQLLPGGAISEPHQVLTHLTPVSGPHSAQLEDIRRRWALWAEGAQDHAEEIPGVVLLAPAPAADDAPPMGDPDAPVAGALPPLDES